MYTSYVIHTDKGLISYYTQNNILYKRVYFKGKWSNSSVIQTGVRQFFSLNIIESEKILIFTHSIKNIVHFLYEDEDREFKNKPILEANNLQKNPYFFCMIDGNLFTIIYAYQIEKYKFNIEKMVLEDGVWSDSVFIDTVYSTNGVPFYTVKISLNHYMLFYDTVQNSLNLCYREITPNKISEKTVYHTTTYGLIDKTFLVTKNSIYTAFLQKSLFSYQLMFRQKSRNGTNNVKVVVEGTKLKNIFMFFYDEFIYIFYSYGDEFFYVYGKEDNDVFFSKPHKLLSKFNIKNNIKKICILNKDREYNQMLADEKSPYQPIVINSINPFFQDVPYRKVENTEKDIDEKVVEEVKKENDEKVKKEKLKSDSLFEQINQLKTEIYLKNNEIAEMRTYISEMESKEDMATPKD
ncbi:MAG: hypothetical protein ACK5LV_03355 [Lachnospirales bacterium]